MEDFIKSFDYVDVWPGGDKYNPNDWNLRTGHVSATALKKLKISPAHFIEEEKPEVTDAMIFGRAYHCYVLEPTKFEKDFFVMDETDILEKLRGEGAKSPRATNAYKEWMSAQMAMAQNKTLIDTSTYEVLKKMKNRLLSHRYTSQLLTNGEAERSFYCTVRIMEGFEIKVIVKPDYLKPTKRAVIELKTTQDASKEGFPKECANYDYQIQAAMYKDFMEQIEGSGMPWSFYFIAQETKAPYAFNIFEASGQFIAAGKYEYEMLMLLFQQCKENGEWPGYQVWTQNRFGINEINLPPWGIRDLAFYNHKNPIHERRKEVAEY